MVSRFDMDTAAVFAASGKGGKRTVGPAAIEFVPSPPCIAGLLGGNVTAVGYLMHFLGYHP